MMKKCYILDGKIINIGEWDYSEQEVDGEIIIHNPLPENAVEVERDCEYDEVRGWYEKGAPKPLSEIELLKISQAEQFETMLELLGGM